MSLAPQAPPTRAGKLSSTPRVLWPGAIGMICMIMAGLGILNSIVQIASPLMLSAMASVNPQLDSTVKAMAANTPYSIALHAIGLLSAVLLLIGGLRLFARRRSSVPMILIWAWIRIPWMVGMLFVTQRLQAAQTQVVQNQQGSGITGAFTMTLIPFFNNIGLVFIAGWYLWLPILLLAWLLRPSIRAQTAAWKP